MRTKLTPAFVQKAAHIVDATKPGRDRTLYWDAAMRCFGLQVTASGHKQWVLQYRAGRRSRRMAIGDVNHLTVEAARREAKKLLGRVASGGDPLSERRQAERAKANSFESIAREYLADGEGKRSTPQYRAILERLVYPHLGKYLITEIVRSDIIRLTDRVKKERGPVMARQTLAVIRAVLNWYARRADDYRPPVLSADKAAPSRNRVLSDDELRAVWRAAEASHDAFGGLVRFLLLTGARRNEAAGMQRNEIVDGVWTIPADRDKSKVGRRVPLSDAAMAVLASMPAIGDQFAFTVSGQRPLSNFSASKRAFDAACGVTGWTIHDLRRTARTLMGRAGADRFAAERVVGHVVGSTIERIYDHHNYENENRRAIEALAALIERIVNPPADNVVALRT